jgi:hypothetical protein
VADLLEQALERGGALLLYGWNLARGLAGCGAAGEALVDIREAGVPAETRGRMVRALADTLVDGAAVPAPRRAEAGRVLAAVASWCRAMAGGTSDRRYGSSGNGFQVIDDPRQADGRLQVRLRQGSAQPIQLLRIGAGKEWTCTSSVRGTFSVSRRAVSG